ncbi:G3E family GTPase [Roseiarcus fermentans]|uniref:G3E family GTPase n=1 Tax=Roseiarcus fermentans TaxID=1473586 RepID=A0A366FR13_9HYPH|nr:GTP-binding protein [Roseiarcus fermentans]RBP16159.1 G3E family GTPase [Roseiarcus fermentans]
MGRESVKGGSRPPSTGTAPPTAALLPFHIVTGFLGAGKTTLINRLLRAPDLADALVMVNEWGEIGLDHLLYERLSGDAILVSGGCVCCALRGDLVDALRDALARRDDGRLPPFRRIVLETTGLAEPAPIVHALFADPDLAARLSLAGVTTVVDAVNGAATAARAESARQIAFADRLVLAKTDLVPAALRAARVAEASATLRRLNPIAPILDGAAGELAPADFLAPISAPPSAAPPSASAGPGHRVQTFVFRSEAAIDPAAFAQFLSALGALLGPRLLRFKGLFALADRPETPILVDGVQHVFHPPRQLPAWPNADRSTRAVLIVEGVGPREADTLWAALTRVPRLDAPDLAALTDNPLAPRPGGLLG